MADARKLTDPETHHADDATPGGGMRGEISRAMVSIMKQYYGKGPTNARTFFNERYVFCVMEGGLTRSDETLLSAGDEELVRTTAYASSPRSLRSSRVPWRTSRAGRSSGITAR